MKPGETKDEVPRWDDERMKQYDVRADPVGLKHDATVRIHDEAAVAAAGMVWSWLSSRGRSCMTAVYGEFTAQEGNACIRRSLCQA
jgi:hypothetical protein